MSKREYNIKNNRERILMLPSNMACFIFEKSDISTLKELASATNPSINVKKLKKSELLDVVLEDYIQVYGSDYYTCMLKDYIDDLRIKEIEKENESEEEKLMKAKKRKAFKRLKEQVEVTSEVVNRDIECLVSDLVINCERMIDKAMEEYENTDN
ncbi:MAG: hypothetical protein ACI3T9_00555 [Romboutsia timonensis]